MRQLREMKFEFLNFYFFLISWTPLFKIELCINEYTEPFNFEITLFNTELIGLYIDQWKTHIGLLGFGLNIWYKQDETNKEDKTQPGR